MLNTFTVANMAGEKTLNEKGIYHFVSIIPFGEDRKSTRRTGYEYVLALNHSGLMSFVFSLASYGGYNHDRAR